jgi:polyhydroxyalkanoate synthesis regulator phasin
VVSGRLHVKKDVEKERTMKKDAKELSEQFKAILEKFGTAYKDIEQQINTEFAARDERIQALEDRIAALEGRA